MKNNSQCKVSILFLVFTFILFSQDIFSQEKDQTNSKRNLYLYSFVSDLENEDTTKLQLCTDLFYSQFEINEEFLLQDKRETHYSNEIYEQHKDSKNLVFYHSVSQTESSWISTLNLIDFATKQEITLTKEYKDFYKILMEAKDTLSELFEKQKVKPLQPKLATETQEKQTTSYTVADLYGTWKGEECIHKIVILGAGRGFIIFDNGASMNVIVKVENQKLVVEQECASIPDYFPEIPLDFASQLDENTNPIVWDLTIENLNLLNGLKNTYAFVESSNSIEPTKIQVSWYR